MGPKATGRTFPGPLLRSGDVLWWPLWSGGVPSTPEVRGRWEGGVWHPPWFGEKRGKGENERGWGASSPCPLYLIYAPRCSSDIEYVVCRWCQTSSNFTASNISFGILMSSSDGLHRGYEMASATNTLGTTASPSTTWVRASFTVTLPSNTFPSPHCVLCEAALSP